MDTVLPAVADGIYPHLRLILTGAGAVGALIAVALIVRWLRRGHTHTRIGTVAVILATAYAAEGMYEVAVGPLGLGTAGALVLCATFEVAMLHQASLAAYKLRRDASADVRRHMVMAWAVAAASGIIASTASSSVTEVLLRLAAPPLAAAIWTMSLYADRPAADRPPSTWIWTPQRIGVRLGLLRPGTVDDLDEVFRQRAVRRLVDAGMVVWTEQQVDGPPSRRLVRARGRLRRLAQRADQATIDAAAEQLRLAIGVEELLLRPRGRVDDAEQIRAGRPAAQPPAPQPSVRPVHVVAASTPARRRTATARVRAHRPTADLDAARKLFDGKPLPPNRDLFAAAVRSAGYTIANRDAKPLLDALLAERTAAS